MTYQADISASPSRLVLCITVLFISAFIFATNDTHDTLGAESTNPDSNSVLIIAKVDQLIYPSLFATCQNNAANFADIFTNGDIQKINTVIKQNIRQANQCRTNKTFCTNDGNNDFFILLSRLGNMEIHDKQKIISLTIVLGQLGIRSGPGGCLNGGQNGFFILASGNGSILADFQQLRF